MQTIFEIICKLKQNKKIDYFIRLHESDIFLFTTTIIVYVVTFNRILL